MSSEVCFELSSAGSSSHISALMEPSQQPDYSPIFKNNTRAICCHSLIQFGKQEANFSPTVPGLNSEPLSVF